MKEFFKSSINAVFRFTAEFMAVKTKRYAFLLVVLSCIALTEFLYLGLARRTFIFYTVEGGSLVVEDRMLKRAGVMRASETDIIRYTEETLLGPVSPDLMPLFRRETRLNSLLFRDGIVYADFSEDAALPPEGETVLNSFRTLRGGIIRNFSSVKDVRFFIEGQAAFYGKI